MEIKLRGLRKKLGLTQAEFAEELGITKMAVSHIETGVRGLSGNLALGIQDFVKSKGIDVSIDELYEGLKNGQSYRNKGKFSNAYVKR